MSKNALKPSILEKMGIDKLSAEFVNRAKSGTKIFLELGIIRHFLEPLVPDGKTITEVLRAAGADRGNISNSAYSMRAYRLMCIGDAPPMTKEQFFDKATFNKCRAIESCLMSKVKNVQTPARIAEVLLTSSNAVEDIESLRDFGKTVAEKKAADDAKQAEIAAKAAAEPEATQPAAPVTDGTPAGDKLAEAMAKGVEVQSGLTGDAPVTDAEMVEHDADAEVTAEDAAEIDAATDGTVSLAEYLAEPVTGEVVVNGEVVAEVVIDPADDEIPQPAPVTEADMAAYVVESLDELTDDIAGISGVGELKSIYAKLQEIACEIAERLEKKVVKMPKLDMPQGKKTA